MCNEFDEMRDQMETVDIYFEKCYRVLIKSNSNISGKNKTMWEIVMEIK
jgi:hypothetical protein